MIDLPCFAYLLFFLCTVSECGDDLSELEDEEVLLVANHQSTADVPALMYGLQFHGRVLDKVMWIMDVMFKHTNFGWVSQMRGDFFIQQVSWLHRVW